MLTRKLEIILLSAICIGGVILVASIQRYRSMPADVLVPSAVTEFHRQEHSRESGSDLLLLITWFRLPYANDFDVIRIKLDGRLSGWVESPGWATGVGGRFEILENQDLDRIKTVVSALPSTQSSLASGKYLITVSFPLGAGYNLFSCSETSCPSILCTVFEMADAMVKKQVPGATGIDCPILK